MSNMCTGRISTRTAFSFSAWEIFMRCFLKMPRPLPPCSTSPLPHALKTPKTKYRWREYPFIPSIHISEGLSPPATAWRSANRSPSRTGGRSSSAASPASLRRGPGCRRTPTATGRSRPACLRARTFPSRCLIPRAERCAPGPSRWRAVCRYYPPSPPTRCFCGAASLNNSVKAVPL